MQPQPQHLERGDTAARDRLLDLTGRVTRLLADHPELRERLPRRFRLVVAPFEDPEVWEYVERLNRAPARGRRWPRVIAVVVSGVVEFWAGRGLKRIAGYRLDTPPDLERVPSVPPLEVGPFLEQFRRVS